MVQQKIVMEVSMNSEKCRLKAMKIALVAGEQLCIKLQLSSFAFDNYNLGLMFKKIVMINYQTGVTSVAIEGADRSKVVVIGDGVDSANLAKSLRKKFCCANIETVQSLG